MSLLDIHAGLQYQVIAPLLGLEPLATYAENATCPYCGASAWAIQQDTRSLEEWHYCSQCKKSGSILAMAAEHLSMSEEDTLEFLADQLQLTVSEKDSQELKRQREVRARFAEAWTEAQYNMQVTGRTQQQYLQGLGWQRPSTMGIERFLEGPGQLYGLLHPVAACKHFRQTFAQSPPVVAVVPFFRTLTDIGSFVCFPRYREVFVSGGQFNCGFAGLPLVQQSQSKYLLVTTLLSPMIMLQLHNFNHSRTPLPLLASRINRRVLEQQWNVLGGRELVLWERKPTAAMIHQAMLTDASLTFLGPDQTRQQAQEVTGNRWWRWVHHEPALDMFNRLIRNARHYEAALKNWAREVPQLDKTSLLKDAERYSNLVFERVRKILAPQLKTNIGSRVNVPLRSHSAAKPEGHTVVIERNGKWYSRTGQVRLSGILRVSHIVARTTGQEYVGWLESGKQRAEFQVPVKKATWYWLRNFAVENGILLQRDAGINQYKNQKTEKFCPFDAACRFQPPVVVRGLERVGWDGEGFQFRRARLVNGTFRQIPEFMFADRVPGPQQGQCRLTEDVKRSLQRDNPEMEATWALAVAMAAQVTTPCTSLPVFGICVQRKAIDPGLSMLYNRLELRRGEYQDWPHRWPRRLDDCRNTQRYDSTNFFVLSLLSRTTRLREILAVNLFNLELEPRLFSHSADKILLHYLRHFTQLERPEVADREAWLNFTLAEFRKVFDFVDTAAIAKAKHRLEFC